MRQWELAVICMCVYSERNHKLEYGHTVNAWLDMKHRLFDKVSPLECTGCVCL